MALVLRSAPAAAGSSPQPVAGQHFAHAAHDARRGLRALPDAAGVVRRREGFRDARLRRPRIVLLLQRRCKFL